MVDVQIHGAGVVGLLLARELRAEGVTVRVVDPRGPFAGASGACLGAVLPAHPEPLDRFVAALGPARGAALLDWARAGFERLPGFDPTGVDWRADDDADADRAMTAAASLGLAAARVDGGVRLLDGGRVDRAALRAALAEVPVTDRPGAAEVEVLATGPAAVDPWLADKLFPVRWQAIRVAGPALERPVVSRRATVFAAGALELAGARWAVPHLGAGETAPVTDPRVGAKLRALAAQDFGVVDPPRAEWAGIVAESCDGLPIFGPLPGRPRVLGAAGLGAAGLTWVGAGVGALLAGLLGRPGARVPAPVSAARFL